MDEPIVLQTETDYRAALSRIDLFLGSEEGSSEYAELESLSVLVEQYEDKHYPIDFPTDPIAAIKFRMDQLDLRQRDLIPIIGSKSKVSELLSGKRDLTLAMARAIHKHLDVPADVLLQEPDAGFKIGSEDIDFGRFPLKDMANLGWIPDLSDLKEKAEEVVTDLMERAGAMNIAAAPHYRKNDHRRINARSDDYALQAWCWQVLAKANSHQPHIEYVPGTVTSEFLRSVAHLSQEKDGPILARKFLWEHGIGLEVVPHLPKTYLDGAALALQGGRPVIGLTLRYDRIDNFWFCLLHELAHVGWHLDGKEGDAYMDDLDLRNTSKGKGISDETQADNLAEGALIPRAEWESSRVKDGPNVMAVIEFSNKIKVHPAVVAGRIRYERHNYQLLTQFVGTGTVRPLFDSVK